MSQAEKLTLWIRGFDLEQDREKELIEWAKEALGAISVREIKVAIQEKIDYNC